MLIFQEAVSMIQKGQTEEKRIYLENTNVPEVADGPRKVPPPPILLCRTDTMMVFKPAPFCSEDGQEVSTHSPVYLLCLHLSCLEPTLYFLLCIQGYNFFFSCPITVKEY